MNTNTDPDFYNRLTAAARCLSDHCQYDDEESEKSAEAHALEAVQDARAALEVMRDFIETAAMGNTDPDDLARMALAILNPNGCDENHCFCDRLDEHGDIDCMMDA